MNNLFFANGQNCNRNACQNCPPPPKPTSKGPCPPPPPPPKPPCSPPKPPPPKPGSKKLKNKKVDFKKLKKNTCKSLNEVECFLNDFKRFTNYIKLYKILK